MRIRRLVALARRPAALLAAVLATFAGPGAASPERFVPDASGGGVTPAADGTFSFDSPGVSVSLALVDEAARRRFLGEHAGTRSDPFASMPGAPPGFLVFRVRIANRGTRTLVFQPQWARIDLGKHDERPPIAWPDVVSAYEMLGSSPPATWTDARVAIYDGEEIVGPGREVERLLPFRRLPEGTKRFAAVLRVTTGDGEQVVATARYRRAKG